MKIRSIAIWLAVILLAVTGSTRADFTLYDNEQLTVDTIHYYGWLYDSSQVDIVYGGQIRSVLWAYDSSTTNLSGGFADSFYIYDSSTANVSSGTVYTIDAFQTSTTNIYGGDVDGIWAYDSSTINLVSAENIGTILTYDSSIANISGGYMPDLFTYDSSTANISGGNMYGLFASGFSTIIFDGENFDYGSGLTLNGNRVLGTGILSGQWLDGTPWSVNIWQNDLTATILTIPEPATLFLLGLGAVILRKRRV